MKVEIFSIMAALVGGRDVTWSGEVPFLDQIEEDSRLDHLYRFFNRVDDADTVRLDELGYNLPNLSAGDFIRVGDNTWEVVGLGFKQVTRNVDYAMRGFR